MGEASTGPTAPRLECVAVTKTFRVGRRALTAVRGVSLTLHPGESLGVVGESGSGKSTLGRIAAGLLAPTSGTVRLAGRDLTADGPRAIRDRGRGLQMIFQDAGASLNPRMTAGRNILDPLIARGLGTPGQRAARLGAVLQDVGLGADQAEAYPRELSGGQQQRVAIARALVTDPDVVVCDEVVSALDVSVQAQVLQLLKALQQARGMAYLFISHNLAAVGAVADRVAVMYLGELVELAPVRQMFQSPQHPYTQALLTAAFPLPRSDRPKRPLTPLPGDIPSLLQRPSGCPFHPRCPVAMDVCRTTAPAPRVMTGDHIVTCHAVEP